MGFMDDFRKGAEKGRDRKGEKPPVEFRKIRTWRAKQWLIAIAATPVVLILLVVALAIGASEVEQSDQQSGESQERSFEQVAGSIGCPTQLFVGLPVEVNLALKNPGATRYPTTFVHLDGFDPFTVNRVSSGGLEAVPADVAGFDPTYEVGTIRGRDARRVTITLTPIEAGNKTLKVWAWGEESEEELVPSDPAIFECPDVPVNP